MLKARITLLLGVLVLAPSLALAVPQTPKPTPKPATSAPATHSTSGKVKSMDATSLVITKTAAGKSEDLTFMVNDKTQKKGTIAVGATVEVRYTTAGKTNTATAVTAQVKK